MNHMLVSIHWFKANLPSATCYKHLFPLYIQTLSAINERLIPMCLTKADYLPLLECKQQTWSLFWFHETQHMKKDSILTESNLFCWDTAAAGKINHMKNVWTLGLSELPAKMLHDSQYANSLREGIADIRVLLCILSLKRCKASNMCWSVSQTRTLLLSRLWLSSFLCAANQFGRFGSSAQMHRLSIKFSWHSARCILWSLLLPVHRVRVCPWTKLQSMTTQRQLRLLHTEKCENNCTCFHTPYEIIKSIRE